MKKLAFVIFLIGLTTSATAQHNAPGKLFQVTDGVFRLVEGQSIDLTDEHLLITLVRGRDECVALAMNGGTGCITNGLRLHLKAMGNAPYYIRGMFTEKQRCFLDVFNMVNVKGQKASADFRLICV